MAPDSRFSPEPRSLSTETLAALRAAVLEHLGRTPEVEPAVARAVSALVSEAHARQMRAEELILAFKTCYASLPDPVSAAGRAEQFRLREQLITACIKAYYADRRDASESG